MFNRICLLFTIALLTACSLSPVNGAQKSNYTLNAVPTLSHTSTEKSQVLLVSVPVLDAVMNNNKMVYVDGQYQVGYFSEHQWAARPNEMLFSVLLNTLQQYSGYRAVVSIPYSGQSDVRLDIVNFSIIQNFTTKPSRVTIKMDARLMNVKQQSVLKTRTIEATVATNEDTPKAGVVAANQALAQCLTQIVAFVN